MYLGLAAITSTTLIFLMGPHDYPRLTVGTHKHSIAVHSYYLQRPDLILDVISPSTEMSFFPRQISDTQGVGLLDMNGHS